MRGVVILLAILMIFVLLRLLFRRGVVMEYEAGLLYESGRFTRRLNAGGHWLFRPTQTYVKVDLRPRLVSVPGQEVICSDGVSLKLSLACRYHVTEPATAINKVQDYQQALYQVLQLSLREIVSGSTGDEMLSARRELGGRLMTAAEVPAQEFGLKVDAVNVKDITLPGELKKIYSQVVLAQKEGQAALERARGESAALRNLANAARLVSDNPALMQLRLIQQVGASSGNTIVLGIPSNSSPIPVTTKEVRGDSPKPAGPESSA